MVVPVCDRACLVVAVRSGLELFVVVRSCSHLFVADVSGRSWLVVADGVDPLLRNRVDVDDDVSKASEAETCILLAEAHLKRCNIPQNLAARLRSRDNASDLMPLDANTTGKPMPSRSTKSPPPCRADAVLPTHGAEN